jgi:hypothetical protein
MIDITQPDMILLRNGVEVSRHRGAVEAMERAATEGPGVYTLVRPDATITVSGEMVEPEPDPEPEPEPTPDPEPTPEPEPEPEPPANLPQSIADAQAAGLLPYYRNLGYSVDPDTDINWTSTAGERDEIGYLPEQHAAYLAGQTDLEASIIEAALQPLPESIAHSHMPNLHWLPLLLTGDKRFVAPMEDIQSRHMVRLNRSEGSSLGTWIYGRELAWGLRHLSQLVWCQEQGLATETWYRDTLDATRDLFLSIMEKPVHERWRVLSFNEVYWRSYGWSGWMESFIGIVLCRMVHMGFEDWRPIAQWHYEQLERRSGGEWSLKDADTDHMAFVRYADDTAGWNWSEIKQFATDLTWSDVQPYSEDKMADPAYAAHPGDEVIFTGRSAAGNRFTYPNRTQGLHQWAVSAIGIDPRAEAKEAQLFASIQRRGDSWDYRHSFRRA